MNWFKSIKINNHKYIINRSFEIPYLAGTSKDGKTIYIDKHLPLKIKIDNKYIDVAPFLAIHESNEFKKMKQGIKYQDAHKFATKIEEDAVKKHNINWANYSKALKTYIQNASKENRPKNPQDLFLKPYEDEHDINVLNEMKHRENL